MEIPFESRTHQYRKVMKPMLERKRRARINRCLDELKKLMQQSEEYDVSRLEKADVLELTVRYIKQKAELPRSIYLQGYGTCADAACGYLHNVDPRITQSLREHLQCTGSTSIHEIHEQRMPKTQEEKGPAAIPEDIVKTRSHHHAMERLRYTILQRRKDLLLTKENKNKLGSSGMWRPWY